MVWNNRGLGVRSTPWTIQQSPTHTLALTVEKVKDSVCVRNTREGAIEHHDVEIQAGISIRDVQMSLFYTFFLTSLSIMNIFWIKEDEKGPPVTPVILSVASVAAVLTQSDDC